MPRYIVDETVRAQLIKWKAMCANAKLPDAANCFKDFLDLLDDTPTADVVPRADYEKEKQSWNDYIADQNGKIDKLKAENEELKTLICNIEYYIGTYTNAMHYITKAIRKWRGAQGEG
jgi:hypothetical protein